MRKLVSTQPRKRRRGRVAIVAALVSCVALVGVASAAIGGFNPFGNQQVGQTYANGVLLPTNQWISPLGTRILDSRRRQGCRLVSSTISPNGQYLAALGWNEFSGYLTIFDLKTGTIVQQTALNTGARPQPERLDGRGRRAAVLAGRQHPMGATVGVPAALQRQSDNRQDHSD